MAQISNCLKIISKLDERDQDALVARLDEIQAHGVPAERAQSQAAIDVLAGLQRAAAPVVRSATRQTDTPAFKAWFGDSKVVDTQGEPLPLYRGGADFRELSAGFLNAEPNDGYAVFASDSPYVASSYANADTEDRLDQETVGAVVPVFVKADSLKEFPVREVNGSRRLDFFGFDEAARRLRPGEVLVARKVYDIGPRASVKADPKKLYSYASDIYAWGRGTSVKSSVGNSGAFDAADPDITRSVARPQFYSQLQRAIEQVPDRLASMAAPQWKLWLDANAPKLGVKKDEVEFSGVTDYLALRGKEKVSRDDLVAYLADSGVRVSETILGGDMFKTVDRLNEALDGTGWRAETNDGDFHYIDSSDNVAYGPLPSDVQKIVDEVGVPGAPKYDSYTVPGGENYREVLITLPEKDPLTPEERAELNAAEAKGGGAQNAAHIRALRGKSRMAGYKSSHFDQLNIVTHLRVDDRVDADGARVLFLNEVQSDWSSDGRKKGFDKPPMKGEVRPQEGYDAALADQWESDDADAGSTWAVYWEDGTFSGGYDTKEAAEQRLRDAARSKTGSVPRGPFVEDTKAYVALALKRAIMMAVEEGHDKVALISGEQAAGLYSLDKQVNELVLYDDNTVVARKNGANVVQREFKTDDELAEIVGKDVAAKLLATKRDMNSQRILRGDDLKVEATGMRKFYDDLIPQVARDVLKKLGGGKLERVTMVNRDSDFDFMDLAEATPEELEQLKGDGMMLEQTGFTITDAMREKVAGGVPLFSRTRGWAGFPDAIIATPPSTQSKDASYEAAKAGDMKAALELVDRVLPADIEQKIRATIGDSKPIVAAVHAEEAAGRNKIPLATAFVIGERMGLQVDDKLAQASRAKRTGAGGMARLGVQPEFAGAVEEGADYLLVDDTLAQGGTLAQLKTHIEDNGGRVVGVFALSGKQYSAKLSLDESTLSDVRAKYEPIENWWKDELGFDFAGLTQSEARYILKSGLSPDALRDQVTAARQAAGIGAGQEDEAQLSRARDPQVDAPEFKAWFGGSKVLDEDGRPAVVYHGRDGDFSRFNAQGGPGKTSGTGAFFSSKPIVADTYATGTEANVAPVYLSLQKPAIFDAQGKNWNSVPQSAKADLPATEVSDQADEDLLAELEGRPAKSGVTRKLKARKTTVREIFKGEWDYDDDTATTDDLARWARSQGYDGVIIRNVKDRGPSGRFSTEEAAEPGVIYVAFSPSQIKSAIGNSGTFDPLNPDITQSKGRTASGADWESPSASKFDDLVYKFQDKQVETKRVVEAIKEASGSLRDDLNVYLNEEMYHGRAAKRTEDFVNMELDPLVREMAKANMKIADLEEFLHARHAKEANAVIAQRNPGEPAFQDGGSGMTNAEADNYMATLPAADRAVLEAAAAKVDAIIAGTRKMFVDYELESQNTVDAWNKMFKHYVPLQREDKEGSPGLGQGFSIKGKETKGRTGSTRKVVDILANIAMQRERAIVRGEKNRVAQSLVGLVRANENPDFWLVDEVPTERVFNPATGLVEDRVDPMYKSRDNAVVAKIKDPSGAVREHAVLFNEEDPRALRMAQALKNLDATQLNGLLGVSAKITRYFAAVNTQYNPVFGVVNLVRDVQGAMLNLTSTPLRDDKAKIARYTASALTGIYGDMRAARKGQNQTSKWAALWDEFQEVGGQTGYRDLFATSADRAEAIQNSLDPSAWMDGKLGKVFTAGGALKVPLAVAQKQAGFIFDWLSDYNGAMENGVRLAAYKAGLERGLSKQQAASIAKNLTTNFNRKGQTAQQAGAMYAFFNAAIQGTARIGQTLFDMEPGKPKTLRLSSAGKKIVYGGILLGSIQAMALAAAGFGEEDPPEFARERSLIIPTGNKTYVSIPMPLGMHIIPNIGRVATEFALSGFKDPIKRSIGMAAMFADAFNPIGNAGMSMQTLAPTALDPLVALTENKDWTGRPISKTSFNKATPGHALGRDTATAVSELLSEAINTLSGGNKYVAGVFSPTPDAIDYIWGQVTGGVGREYSKTEQTLKSIIRGESLPTYKIPLVGRFVGNAKGQASEGSAFYANVDRLNEIETEAKGLKSDGRDAEARKLIAENPESYLMTAANYAERQVQKLRRQKSELVKAGAPREQVKSVEEQITQVMARFNRASEELRERATAAE